LRARERRSREARAGIPGADFLARPAWARREPAKRFLKNRRCLPAVKLHFDPASAKALFCGWRA
jgi:hypothetical protein